MTVQNTTSTSLATPYVPGSQRVPQKNLGQDDFLKLLTVQLAKQDPMKPMDDMSFIGQMAEFTSLEQSSQMVKEFASLRQASDFASASNLLGRQVTVQTKEEGKVTGAVTGIDAADGTPKLMVNGKLYPLTALKQVTTEVALPAA
jgi:flagellar basal-body rod modification protein FlgD